MSTKGVDAELTVAIARPGAGVERLIEADGSRETSVADRLDVLVYVGTDDTDVSDRVFEALDAVVAALGYDGPYDVAISSGSIFRRSRAILRRGVDAADLRVRLAKVERALELSYLDRRQADVDAVESEAVRRLVDSLKDVPQACLRIGSIFLIKFQDSHGPVLVVRTLSPLEAHTLERFPEIQRNPRVALEALATAMTALQAADREGKPLVS